MAQKITMMDFTSELPDVNVSIPCAIIFGVAKLSPLPAIVKKSNKKTSPLYESMRENKELLGRVFIE